MELNIHQKHLGVGDNIVGHKTTQLKDKKCWFSMSNPIVWIIASVLAVLICYFFKKIL